MSSSPVWWSEEQYNDYGYLRRSRSMPACFPANREAVEVQPFTPGRISFDEFEPMDANGEESPPELPRQRTQSTSTDDLEGSGGAAATSCVHINVVQYGEGTLNLEFGDLENPVIHINLQCRCCGDCCAQN